MTRASFAHSRRAAAAGRESLARLADFRRVVCARCRYLRDVAFGHEYRRIRAIVPPREDAFDRRFLTDHSRHDLQTELAIAVELQFAIELIRRRFIRKCGVRAPVRIDVGAQVANDPRLHVQDLAYTAISVGDVAEQMCAIGNRICTRVSEPIWTDVDVGTEIRARSLNRLTEVAEAARRIRARIAYDDEATSPPYQLVDAEVLEVTAIGQMNLGFRFRQATAKHLTQHQLVPSGPAPLARRLARIVQPDAEPRIE